MRVVLARLWSEQDGAIVSAEVMLVATILVIGSVVGLKSVRDAVVTELADVAQAISNVDQSYSYSATAGHHAYTGGGRFWDRVDFCDTNFGPSDVFNSKCVVICSAETNAGFLTDGGLLASGGDGGGR